MKAAEWALCSLYGMKSVDGVTRPEGKVIKGHGKGRGQQKHTWINYSGLLGPTTCSLTKMHTRPHMCAHVSVHAHTHLSTQAFWY